MTPKSSQNESPDLKPREDLCVSEQGRPQTVVTPALSGEMDKMGSATINTSEKDEHKPKHKHREGFNILGFIMHHNDYLFHND